MVYDNLALKHSCNFAVRQVQFPYWRAVLAFYASIFDLISIQIRTGPFL